VVRPAEDVRTAEKRVNTVPTAIGRRLRPPSGLSAVAICGLERSEHGDSVAVFEVSALCERVVTSARAGPDVASGHEDHVSGASTHNGTHEDGLPLHAGLAAAVLRVLEPAGRVVVFVRVDVVEENVASAQSRRKKEKEAPGSAGRAATTTRSTTTRGGQARTAAADEPKKEPVTKK